MLLAWAMNGETLTPEHGYPLRVVVPGYAGVRSPKWLTAITVQDAPSDSPIQADDYKLFPRIGRSRPPIPAWPDHRRHARQFRYLHAQAHAMLPSGPVAVSGYAVATMRPIVRVDVSADDGRRWRQAELQIDSSSPWAWTLWHTEIDLPQGVLVLAVRAWDEAGQTQPDRPAETWNYRRLSLHRLAPRAGHRCLMPRALGATYPRIFVFLQIPEEIDDGNEIPVPLVRRGNRA